MISKFETWLMGMLQTIFDSLGWLGVAGIMAFENATSLTPSEVTLGLAGWLLLSAHDAPFSMVFLGALYAAVGSLAGASLTYWTARLGGRPLIDRIAGWLHIHPCHITAAEKQFLQRGAMFVLFGRLLPTVRTLVTIPAGLAKMPYARFAALTFAGAYTWCALLIGAGYVVGKEWLLFRDEILTLAESYAPIAAAALALAAGGWLLLRYIRSRQTGRPEAMQVEADDHPCREIRRQQPANE